MFAKPKQMKQEDYYSSSDEDEDQQDLMTAQKQDDNRASDDSEYNFTDDEESGDEVMDEDESEDEVMEEDDEEIEFDDEKNTSLPEEDDRSDSDSSVHSDKECSEDDDEDDEADTEDAGNAGWAKSLAKILKQEKPKNKKSVVLSKAKKLSEILEAREKAKSIGFAIEGEVKEEKPDVDELNLEVEERKKKKQITSLRIRPTLMDRERERAFKKIATKGVVQLFNAVRTQQKDLVQKLDAAGRLDHKRDAVLNNINKRKFLDVLMGGARAKSENVDNPVKDEESDMDEEVYNDGLPKNSIWSVLK